MKTYIPVELWKSTYANPAIAEMFTFVEKVPLSKIRIDKKLLSWQNEVSPSFVDFIVENFDIDFWMPILVNSDYFLLDGQHRLQAARIMGLKYIDVVMDRERSK